MVSVAQSACDRSLHFQHHRPSDMSLFKVSTITFHWSAHGKQPKNWLWTEDLNQISAQAVIIWARKAVLQVNKGCKSVVCVCESERERERERERVRERHKSQWVSLRTPRCLVMRHSMVVLLV